MFPVLIVLLLSFPIFVKAQLEEGEKVAPEGWAQLSPQEAELLKNPEITSAGFCRKGFARDPDDKKCKEVMCKSRDGHEN